MGISPKYSLLPRLRHPRGASGKDYLRKDKGKQIKTKSGEELASVGDPFLCEVNTG